MKKMTVFLMTLFIGLGLSAQTTRDDKPAPPDKPADFAIVDLTPDLGGRTFLCILKYSDGKVFSLDKTLDMAIKGDHKINQDDIDAMEFKVMNYFKEIGYEFINVSQQYNFLESHHDALLSNDNLSIRFYFKRKGI